MPTNSDITAALDMLADLMELDGVNKFRTIAVRKGARRIAESNFSIEEAAARGELTAIPDIGERIAAKIEEFITSGKITEIEDYLKTYPSDLVAIQKLDGMGPRTARRVWEELGVTSLGELEEAASDGRIAGLPGMGAKTAENILKASARLRKRDTRLLLGEVLPTAKEVVGILGEIPQARNVSLAGSVRRMRETVKDIDIIATATEPEALISSFGGLPMVAEVIGSGPTKCSIRTHTGLQIDLRVVPHGQFGSLLQHFTGSKEHNVALRELAITKGLKVNEYGVEETGTGVLHKCATEVELYRLLGLDYIPPELRENNGEIEAAATGRLPDLVEDKDLKGDLHIHSDWSDGTASIMEMASAAQGLGYKYIAVSDHTKSMGMVHGLTPERLEEQLVEIAQANEQLDGFHVFSSAEVDVLADGTLDLPDESLAQLDFVTVAIHSGFNQNREQIMERLYAAMENRYVRAIGHPTGRLINKRDPYEVDIGKIIGMAARTGTALEINSHYRRLDLSDLNARAAQDAGVRLIISSDAHHPDQLGLLSYGVATARRGWIVPGTVLNTLSVSQLKKLIKKPKTGIEKL